MTVVVAESQYLCCRITEADAPYRADVNVPPPQMPPAQEDARLAALVVQGPGGPSYDLSSQFQPDISTYGVMVPTDLANASLCMRPFQGMHPL